MFAALAGCLVTLGCLSVAHVLYHMGQRLRSDSFAWGGRLCALIVAGALTVCCAVLVWCFMTGDTSLEYVVRNRSNAEGGLAWLYKLSGLWAGRAGSLLLWAWLISVFNAALVLVTRKGLCPLDNGALAVSNLVLLAFLLMLAFSQENMPFTPLDPRYLDASGSLVGAAQLWGMNALLEHWAMAVHPPTLFVGYAGLTLPFAYAMAALVVNDDSALWVNRATPYLMFSWLFLGVGIGLGAVWAYVVLGWGGYWGWDPVENASLLPWLVGVALIHSFTVYRKRGAFKRWSVMCACLTFSFVILGTFITRSGIVESVHAFGGDSVSLALLLALIVAAPAGGAIGLLVRRRSFCAASAEDEDIDSFFSKDAAYYVGNLVMVVFAVLLAYMTVSSALPAFMPFGGKVLSAGTYNAVARPLGIVYCALLAVCPFLGWRKTDRAAFRRQALVPGICAAVLFAGLMVLFATRLLPAYQATLSSGGSAAAGLLEQGPGWYYNGLAVAAFAVASLLFFSAAFMTARVLRRARGSWRRRLPAIGGGVAHAALGVILVGLVGSSMYVTETAGYLPYDPHADSASEAFVVGDYELTFAGSSVTQLENGEDAEYRVAFEVARGGEPVGVVEPSVLLDASTSQQKLNASVMSFPGEDLFVVYRGVGAEGALSLDVRVNPLINCVWAGFVLLMIGSALPLFAKRGADRRGEDLEDGLCEASSVAAPGDGDATKNDCGSDAPASACGSASTAGDREQGASAPACGGEEA